MVDESFPHDDVGNDVSDAPQGVAGDAQHRDAGTPDARGETRARQQHTHPGGAAGGPTQDGTPTAAPHGGTPTGPPAPPAGEGPAPTAGVAPIAVVGISCRLPGAANPRALWALLRDGVEAVGAPPAERWAASPRALAAGHPERAGYLDRVDAFDARFFGIAPREADAMDPQQRLLLELAWEAAEDARTDPTRLGDRTTAVFATAIWQDYAELAHHGSSVSRHSFTGLQRGLLANRISYALGLTGPSLTVDTGQSSSLVAVHLAGESLRRGESDAALVGGVNLILAPSSTRASAALGALSPDGRCYTFDARANGYVRGEGGVVLLLKTLEAALADGDRIYCVIEGSAVNNDGGGDSLTTPHGRAQKQVVRRAHAQAGTRPEQVQYVELHGTGTPVGDPVEAAALGSALGRVRADLGPLHVGSVKTNIGHLEGAAGIAGLLKTVLSVFHRELPPSLHHTTPPPSIPLDALGLTVRTEHGPWPDPGRRLLAGVSSFGIGGTNCHVVVAEAPNLPGPGGESPHPPGTATGPGPAPHSAAPGTAPAPDPERAADGPTSRPGATPVPWVLSGHSPAALAVQADRLRQHARAHPRTPLHDTGHSLATTRANLRHRAVVIGTDHAGLIAGLGALADGTQTAPGVVRGLAHSATPGPVLVFPGQGAQWPCMARELMDQSAVFAAAMERCARALAPFTEWDFATELAGPLERVDVVQPLSWAVMVSLAELWRTFGVTPAAVVGHSQGEIAAAVVCGALSLADGAKVVALRSRIIRQRLAGRGGMVSVTIGPQETADRLSPWAGRLSIAAHNGPFATVVSGAPEAVRAFADACERDAIRARHIPVDYASHSSQVESVREELHAALATVRPGPERVPFHSTVTGRQIPGTALDAPYWADNLRNEVRFGPVISDLIAAGHEVFIEVSAHPVVGLSIQQNAEEAGATVAAVSSLRRDEGGLERFVTALAEAYAQGVAVDWSPLFPAARRVDLPTYAFQRESHWLAQHTDPAADAQVASATLVIVPEATDRPRPPQPEATSAGQAPWLRELARATPQERERALLTLVNEEMARVLGLRGSEVDDRLTFREAGFDSASSVEFRDRLNAATGLTLPTTILFRYPTPALLVRHLQQDLFPAGAATALPPDLDRDLSQLADALTSSALDPAARASAASRLRTLLNTIDDAPPAPGDEPADDDDIASATDSEMFALIDKELGIG